jgi:hypothetical protein
MCDQVRREQRVLFSLGQVYATPGALECLQQQGTTPLELIKRHVSGDWGELDAEDRAENNRALTNGTRILSNYPFSADLRIWVITEADRSSTTLLLPSEY